MKQTEIDKKINKIAAKTWLIMLAASLPVIVVIVGYIWKTESPESILNIVIILLFVFGIGLIAAKLSAYSIINRNLNDIAKLDKAKTDFVAIAAHQLKSPVASIRWRLEDFALAIEEKDWKEVASRLSDLDKSSERLSRLTSDLLNVTKIDTDQIEYRKAEFNPQTTINNLIGDMEPLAKRAKLEIKVSLLDNPKFKLFADENLFKNVLQNLLTNAIKYSKAHTTIEIAAMAKGNSLVISVSNISETPITDETLKSLFQKFYRSEDVKKKEIDGSGLGLFIAKSFVEKWGGNISAYNKANDEVCFEFNIPIST